LGRRLPKFNKELADEKNRADQMEELLDSMKQKFLSIKLSPDENNSFNEIKDWFNESLINLEDEINISPLLQMEEQIKQFMQPHVRLLPSRHNYISDKSETLLESALRSGLAVDYGCNNGKCGKCKAKLVSGQVGKTGQQDYVFSAEEKSQGYILTCSNTAITDITLETEEAVSADDIPLQTLNAKIKKTQTLNDKIVKLALKLPRSQRLRFMAGQHIELTLDNHSRADGSLINAEYSIASCPCEPHNLEFHIPIKEKEPFSEIILNHLKNNEPVTLTGPHGSFVLNEDSPNSLIFVAWDTGFAPVRSLIEHAISLDSAEKIHLYWITTKVENHYLDNLCRSWNDALDNFNYTPMLSEAKTPIIAETLMQKLHEEHHHLLHFDLYIAAPGHLNQYLKPLFISHGIKTENQHFESTFHGETIDE